MAREGKRLPLALVWQIPKSRVHHWLELPQTLINSKINRPTLHVQNEGADYKYIDGPHGCEVPSENDNFGSVFMISAWTWNFIDKNNKIGNEKKLNIDN